VHGECCGKRDGGTNVPGASGTGHFTVARGGLPLRAEELRNLRGDAINQRSDSLRFSPEFVDNDPTLFSSLEVYVAFFAQSEKRMHRFLYVPMDE
jgi:hypothetical protein